MKTEKDYLAMQKKYYSKFGSENDNELKRCIGGYGTHQKFPYEKYLLKNVKNPENKIALDFGCGSGRMILRMGKLMKRVDGVDIGANLIKGAKRWTKDMKNKPLLYVNDGKNLNGILNNTYDLVFCTISFHHIAPYSIRLNLLKEFFRVLKVDGKVALQLFYTNQARSEWKQHVNWLDNPYNAKGTNSSCDVRITPQNLPDVEKTFIDVGFINFEYKLVEFPPKSPNYTHSIYLYAEKC